MAASKHKILFLCTGNYYRSRFAEILFNSIAGKMGLSWSASSMGLALERGVNNVGPIARSAIETLAALGIRADDAATRFPVQVTANDLEAVERIVALKQTEHEPLMQERFPAFVDKIEYWHIDDAPHALALVEREVMALVARILGGSEQSDQPAAVSNVTPVHKPAPLTAKVGRETKGRRGKGVTIVSDVPLDDAGLLDLAATLKQKCGTGGTVKEGRIEIQGDQRDRLISVLEEMGFRVKRVGG